MRLQNVSGLSVQNSDYDYNLWVSPRVWTLATKALKRLGIGSLARATTYRLTIGRLELFLIDSARPDYVTLAVAENSRIMHNWTSAERKRYLDAKRGLEHLSGFERKQAKANLALMFGLSAEPYR